MPEVHAILSASSSKRWLNYTPSARLEQNFPNESSVYAEEGTTAHALGEYKLRKYLHERVKRPTSEYEDEEMGSEHRYLCGVHHFHSGAHQGDLSASAGHGGGAAGLQLPGSIWLWYRRLRDHRRRYALCYGLQERQGRVRKL